MMTRRTWIAVVIGVAVAVYAGISFSDRTGDAPLGPAPDEPLDAAPAETGIVAFVIDGDTIELTNGERVRYIGVDTPEKGACYYEEAKAHNRQLVAGKQVTLTRDVTDRDQYGRLLRYVSVSNGPTSFDVSRALIREGSGRTIYIEPDVARYHSYRVDEGFAFQAKAGLWGACQ